MGLSDLQNSATISVPDSRNLIGDAQSQFGLVDTFIFVVLLSLVIDQVVFEELQTLASTHLQSNPIIIDKSITITLQIDVCCVQGFFF